MKLGKMKKILWALLVWILNIWFAWAYVTIDEADAVQIEKQINSTVGFSYEQKKEKSKVFYALARKSYEIRKAFTYATNTVPDVELSWKEWNNIKQRIAILKKLWSAKRWRILTQLRTAQYLAQELWRLYEIESNPTFQWYWTALTATPVFQLPRDNPNINEIMWWPGTQWPKFDESNLIREVIVVYPKWTVFSLISKKIKWKFVFYEVRTNEFDGKNNATHSFYIDSRFVEVTETHPKDIVPKLPSSEQILLNMHNALGSAYIRWWTRYQWVPELNYYFPSEVQLSAGQLKQKTLKWVDCSWLLYQATNGYTPRNSHWLLTYWNAVEIEWNTIDQIIKKLRPLDLIVWAGHVIIVYDANNVIESRWYPWFKGGVMMTKTKTRLQEIFETRKPVNNWSESKLPNAGKFVVRRRYGIM